VLDVQEDPLPPLDPGPLSRRCAPRWSGGAALAVALAALGCRAAPAPTVRPVQVAAARVEPAPEVVQPPLRLDAIPLPAVAADDISPDVLRPAPDSVDSEVARVGDRAIHKRDLYDRLLETNPQQARDLVDSIVLDLFVADLAERYGVRLTAAEIEAKLAEEEQQLRERLQAEWQGKLDYDRYLLQQFGMDAKEYARWRRLTLARTLYRQYVIRYHAMRDERVQVRFIVASDRAVLEDVRRQVLDGASFSRLALRHSEDESRKDGGLLPPFGPGLAHPITEVALGLQPGALSEVFEAEVDGQRRFFLVSCLRRIPAETRPFAEVRTTIDEDIKARPLSRFDFHTFYFAMRGGAAQGANEPAGR